MTAFNNGNTFHISQGEAKTPSDDVDMNTSMTDSMINALTSSQPSADTVAAPTTEKPAAEISVEAPTGDSTVVPQNTMVDDLISGVASIKVEGPHVNGDSPVPMDTTPTQSVDLLGTISDVHSVNHNGVDNTSAQTSQG